MNTYQTAIVKAQKEKQVVESQFTVLESEKTTLNKALEEAKATRDEAIAMVDFLKFEGERLVRVAKEEVKEKVVKAISKREEAIKALEEEKVDRRAAKVTIKEEAKEKVVGDILMYTMNYRHSVLFMIKKKYHELDFANIGLTQIRGYNVFDPMDGSEPIRDLNVGGVT